MSFIMKTVNIDILPSPVLKAASDIYSITAIVVCSLICKKSAFVLLESLFFQTLGLELFMSLTSQTMPAFYCLTGEQKSVCHCYSDGHTKLEHLF